MARGRILNLLFDLSVFFFIVNNYSGPGSKKGPETILSLLSFLEFLLSVFLKIHRLSDDFGEANGLVFSDLEADNERPRLFACRIDLTVLRHSNKF